MRLWPLLQHSASGKTYGIVTSALVIVFIGMWFGLSTDEPANMLTATPAPLTETIYFSGTVEPLERTTLAFERSGRIRDVRYHRGDAVQRGAHLAYLDAAAAQANLAREQALLETEIAQQDVLVRGATAEEIAVERARVAQYTHAEETARIALENAFINAFTVADNAVYTVADELFENPRSHVPTIRYVVSDRSLTVRLEQRRLEMEGMFASWRTDIATLLSARKKEHVYIQKLFAAATLATPSVEPLTEKSTTTKKHLLQTRSFLEDTSQYVSLLDTSISQVPSSQIATWRTSVGSARTAVQQALSTLDVAHEKYTTAAQARMVGESQLALILTGASPEDIRLQESRIQAQRARVLSQEAELALYTLRAPASGTVVERYKEPGELASPGEAVFVIDSGTLYEIEGRVSELDVVRLQKDMHGVATFDALGTALSIPVEITHIDTALRNFENDNGYGVTLKVVDDANRLRAGMTATIAIELVFNEQVIAVPKTYIRRSDTAVFVQTYEHNTVTEVPVTTGEQTVDGRIAILSGISAGTRLVPYAE